MADWITKKEKPVKKTGWIVKKQPKTNWITKKEAEEHDTSEARKWITKKKPKSGGSSILDVFKSYGKYSGKPKELKGGGKATKGLGRAFQKGGKV